MVHEIAHHEDRPRMDTEEKEVRNSATGDDLDDDDDDRRVVLLFYKYFQNVKFVDAVNSVERLSSHQKQFCTQHNLKGRILIATEGVNGTLSGRRADIEAYIKSCEQYQEEVVVVVAVANDGIDAQNQENSNDASNGNGNGSSKEMKLLFQSVDWKYSDIPKADQGVYHQEPFPDLKVSIVKEIVSTGGLISVDDLTETGNHLTPEEFHETLSKSQEDGNKKIVLVDVRNTFEHNIGHFTNPSAGGEKAMNPEMVTFSSFDRFCNDNKDKLHDHKVLMYCTGGIRCEKASVMMKRKGIQDVNQLSGGIHRYLEKYGSDGHFKGLNFTFDKRVAVKPTATTTAATTTTTTNDASTESSSDSSATYEVVGRCLECQNPFDELCGSRVCTVCRDLVLVCPKCREGLREYHCERHSEWKSCYFTFLESFDRDELLAQKIELLSIRDTKYAPTPSCKHKNIRRTLSRQTEKLEQQIRWMDGNNRTKGVKDAPRRCRTCMERSTVCDGRCWGFWKTDGSHNKVENDNNDGSTGTPPNNPILPIAVGDRVEPGKDWNPIRLGDKTDPSSSSPSGSLRKGVVVEIKSWAGSEKDCVAVLWDDMTGIKSRNSGKIQPQIYRFGVLACDGRTRLYDVCKI